ncbi:MAG: sigma factor-like helix-turn-helix DNA-binding protein [Desulfobacterales bacterium]|nr:sigma factor-like helix-turn-helix DNA-binding protein [Desulfobacterales bacterium]
MRSSSFCGGIKPSMNPDTVDSLYTQQVKKKLTAILDSMDEMQRRVLEMRLGLIDGREMTVEEVAAELGEELLKVQQWEDQALRIMHHPELAWNKDED